MAAKPMAADRLGEQKAVVEKAAESKMLDKYRGVMLSGDNSKIIRAIAGELKNTHCNVFKKLLAQKKECEHCGFVGGVGSLDRAHTISKLKIAKEVMDTLHPEICVPIDMYVFMKEFVMRHISIGVWILCKKCHNQLG